MHVLFVDSLQAEPYGLQDLSTKGLGGAQSAALRVMERLSNHCDITFAQRRRTDLAIENPSFRCVPLSSVWNGQIATPDAIVCIRKLKPVQELRALYPHASIYVWLHNFLRRESLWQKWKLRRARATLICVSRYHRDDTNTLMNGGPLSRLGQRLFQLPTIPVRYIYNPIDENLQPADTEIDTGKMVFFSAPDKGLREVLAKFRAVRRSLPDLRLLVSSPEYAVESLTDIVNEPGVDNANVSVIGTLTQQQLWEQVASALCVFYPQTGFRETFGLVYAEANAVGTPVLAHDIGAAREVLCSNNPLIDCNDDGRIADTLLAWKTGGRPELRPRAGFASGYVCDGWTLLLSAHHATAENPGTVINVSAHFHRYQ